MSFLENDMQALATGSHRAFEKLFHTYYSRIYGFVYGLVKNKTDAADLTQVVFMRVWDKRAYFAEVKQLDAYLFRLTKHTVLNYMARQTEQVYEAEEILEKKVVADEPLADLVAKDLELLIETVVEQMPPRRRQIYNLHRLQGLSNDEIAEQMGIQRKTVENQLSLALATLKRMILLFICFF